MLACIIFIMINQPIDQPANQSISKSFSQIWRQVWYVVAFLFLFTVYKFPSLFHYLLEQNSPRKTHARHKALNEWENYFKKQGQLQFLRK